MNLFLLAWRPAGGLDLDQPGAALTDLVRDLPEPRPLEPVRWLAPSGRVALACSAHNASLLGGVRYAHRERERFALFTGRPFRWMSEATADGRGPLHPSGYLAPAGDWMDDLDGRYAVVRYDDLEGSLELWTDPLGAYPLFWCEREQTVSISNSAQLLRRVLGEPPVDLGAIATMAACGWALGGSLYEGVSRIARGAAVSLRPGHPALVTQQLTRQRIAEMMGAGFDAPAAADRLVAATAALADWPGRPSVLRLSGGRDSRLVLAAALAAELDLVVVSDGNSDSPDVQIAGRLCRTAGLRHEVRAIDHEASDTWIRETARWLGLTGAAISLEDASGYFAAGETVMPLVFNGQGGEIARLYYGVSGSSGRRIYRLRAGARRWARNSAHEPAPDPGYLSRDLLPRVATSADLLTPRGRELMARQLLHAQHAGLADRVRSVEAGDLFYIEHRMGGWAATGHGCVEYAAGDVVCPLWGRRLLPQQLGAPSQRRAAEHFHEAVLAVLAPQLAAIPYAGWTLPAAPSAAALALQPRLRGFVDEHPALPLWEVLDRRRVSALLYSLPASLDFSAHVSMLRLATVLLALPWETS